MTPTQFASKTRNLAKSTGLNAQLVQRHFMMDRLIEFLNGTWGSGKTECLNMVSNQAEEKILYF